MDARSDVRWSSAVRTVIAQKLDDFDAADKLAAKSRLTAADARVFANRIDASAGRHAQALLNEGRR